MLARDEVNNIGTKFETKKISTAGKGIVMDDDAKAKIKSELCMGFSSAFQQSMASVAAKEMSAPLPAGAITGLSESKTNGNPRPESARRPACSRALWQS